MKKNLALTFMNSDLIPLHKYSGASKGDSNVQLELSRTKVDIRMLGYKGTVFSGHSRAFVHVDS